MYKLEYDSNGALMMVKIEEICLFTPKSVDAVIARLRSLRDKHWHDWPGDRHNRKALEMRSWYRLRFLRPSSLTKTVESETVEK